MAGARMCVHMPTDVVPAEFDSCFDKSGAFSHLRAATARVDEDEDTVAGSILTECRFDLTAARPLAPAEPGDVCMWAGNSIHWCLLTVVSLCQSRRCCFVLLVKQRQNNYTFDPVSSCKQTEHFASADRGARASADSAAPPRSSIAVRIRMQHALLQRSRMCSPRKLPLLCLLLCR